MPHEVPLSAVADTLEDRYGATSIAKAVRTAAERMAGENRALRTDLDTARHLLSLWTDTRPPLEEVEGETLAALTVRFLAESSHHPAEPVNVDRAQVAALGGAR